jgi:hypothetical protein
MVSEWKKVAKRGKRTAENLETADPKRSDVRDTPTKRKPSPKGLGLSLTRPIASKITTFYNPYKAEPTARIFTTTTTDNSQKHDAGAAANRATQKMDHLSPNTSPFRSLPAAEAKPGS